MKTTCVLSLILALGICNAAMAQDSASDKTGLPPVQAPPSMHDPGVASKSADQQSATKPHAARAQPAGAHAPDNPGLPPDVQAKANVAELPVVTVRQRGSDTIEEYRKHGKLVFVRVLSKNGPTKYYVDNPGDIPRNLMKQMSGPSGVVQPVYYKLYEWK